MSSVDKLIECRCIHINKKLMELYLYTIVIILKHKFTKEMNI
jgi:hypothetical protein